MMSWFILSFLFKFDDVVNQDNQHKTKEYPAKPQSEISLRWQLCHLISNTTMVD